MDDRQFMEYLKFMQVNEIREKLICEGIAKSVKNKQDKETLLHIARQEQVHYDLFKKLTKQDVRPNMCSVYWYILMGKILGYTFAVKLMEIHLLSHETEKKTRKQLMLEEGNQELFRRHPEFEKLFAEEVEHELKMIQMIDEEKLKYVGSMVLGLNDALVEFSGSLAGWSFAMQSNRMITLAGLITGISATLSMASSEYLSAKNEGREDALKSSGYTGIAYLFTVVALLLPYILLPDHQFLSALIIMLAIVILIIAGFNYYISVARNEKFSTKFREMILVSLSVAGVSFLIGLLVKKILGIDI